MADCIVVIVVKIVSAFDSNLFVSDLTSIAASILFLMSTSDHARWRDEDMLIAISLVTAAAEISSIASTRRITSACRHKQADPTDKKVFM